MRQNIRYTHPVNTAPTAINGRRRPQGVRALSDRFPMTGSKKAFHANRTISTAPSVAGLIPMPMLKYGIQSTPVNNPVAA